MRASVRGRSGGRIAPCVIGVLFMLAAVAIGSIIARAWWNSRKVSQWDAAECTVLKSDVERHAIDSYAFHATFEYEVDGRKVRSSEIDRPASPDYFFRSVSERLPLLERFAAGSRHVCRVNPTDPLCAVLVVKEPGNDWGLVFALAIVGVFLLFGGCLFLTSFGSRKPGRKRSGRPIAVFLVVFGLVFLCGGGGALIAYGSTRLKYSGLDSVEGRVLYAGLVSHSGDRGSTTYAPCIAYEYEVGGRKYENDRFSAIECSSSNRRREQDVVDGYRPGEPVTVHYSPDDPARSCLKPEGTAHVPVTVLLCIFPAVGLFLVGIGVRALLPKRGRGRNGEAHAYGLELRRRLGTDVMNVVVFACIWNVMVWPMAAVFLSDFSWPGFGPELFVLLFPAVGVVIAVKAVRALLTALCGVRHKMTLSSDRLVPGGRAQVNVERTGGGEVTSVRLEVVQWNMALRVLREGDPDPREPARRDEVYAASSPVQRSWSASFEIPESIDSPNVRWELCLFNESRGRAKKEVFRLPVVAEERA